VKILRVRVAALATVTGLVLLGAGVSTAQASKPPDHQVTLCHRTGSVAGGNTHAGYSIITVDIAAVANTKDVRGHDGHNQVGNGPDGDIIPSYTYRSFTYPGKNLANGGAAFLENDCKALTSPVTTTTTPTETTTTTPTETTTTTPTETTTTTPAETTTTTPAETTTTTPAETTTMPVNVAGTVASTTVASTTAPVDVLGASASETNPLPAGAAAGQANTGRWLTAGLTGLTALLALGAGLVLRRRHGVA